MAKCNICERKFEPRNKNHKFCSGGCRQKNHRKKHGIDCPFGTSNNDNSRSPSDNHSLNEITKKHKGWTRVELLDHSPSTKGGGVESVLKMEEEFLEISNHVKKVCKLRKNLTKNLDSILEYLSLCTTEEENTNLLNEAKKLRSQIKLVDKELLNNYKLRANIISTIVQKVER